MIFLSSCERRTVPAKDDPLLARINAYRMMASDFNDEKKPFLNYVPLQDDPATLKGQILTQLITRQVLLQEAQRLDLDKDTAFMKDIENYWKQALLTSLLRRKSDELGDKIVITDDEAAEEYAAMRRKFQVEIVSVRHEQTALSLSGAKEAFETVKQSLGPDLVADLSGEWWERKDMSMAFRGAVAKLDKGDVSQPFREGEYWQVVRIMDVAIEPLDPLETMRPDIIKQIRKERVAKELEAWVDRLMRQAEIKIDQKVLSELKLN
jgi:hypothetical protein